MFMIALVQVPKDSGHQNFLPNLFPLPFTTPFLLGPTAAASNALNRRIGSPRRFWWPGGGASTDQKLRERCFFSHFLQQMKTGSLLVACCMQPVTYLKSYLFWVVQLLSMVQKSGDHQLIWSKIPSIYRVVNTSNRWLALGFLNHQQYEGHDTITIRLPR